MKHSEIKALAEEIGPIVTDLLAEAARQYKAQSDALTARIDVLEKQLVSVQPAGLTAEQVADEIKRAESRAKAAAEEAIQSAIESQGDSEPDVMTVEDIKALIVSEVASAVSDLPPAQKGEDGRDGADGVSVTADDVLPALEKRVDEFLASVPVPKDGRDGVDGKDGEPGMKGDPGRDGLDVKDLFRADGGRLVAVMSDGTTKDMGVFVGRDGENGAPGRNGADGIGFDEVTLEIGADGRPVAKFQRGDIVKSVTLPCIIDRGVYRAGEVYVKGDAVSFGGSLWIAQKDTAEKPETGEGWRLAVKKGRDGKVA